jgi:hypothetical protein
MLPSEVRTSGKVVVAGKKERHGERELKAARLVESAFGCRPMRSFRE